MQAAVAEHRSFWRSSGRPRLLDRFHARFSGTRAPGGKLELVVEPPIYGSIERGQALISGKIKVDGWSLQIPSGDLWQTEIRNPVAREWLHGFTWLDDLATLRDPKAVSLARGWTRDWIDSFGRGKGPGWSPEIVARRVTKWLQSAFVMLPLSGRDARQDFFGSIARHTEFLSRRWQSAPRGVARLEALTGLVCAELATGRKSELTDRIRLLSKEAAFLIREDGDIPSRNPEELLKITYLLNLSAAALLEVGQTPGEWHWAAIRQCGSVLRNLRHSNGSLARFHGGGDGPPHLLDRVLADTGTSGTCKAGLAMGFARLVGGRTTVVADVAPPPTGRISGASHASTLSFEMVTGDIPLVVSRGPQGRFPGGEDSKARETRSHSTVDVDGQSSSTIVNQLSFVRQSQVELISVPGQVHAKQLSGVDGRTLVAGHDGYTASHGLTHERQLHLEFGGGRLRGQDRVVARTDKDKRRLSRLLRKKRSGGIWIASRFHLHPDVEARLKEDGRAVELTIRNGESWMLHSDGPAPCQIADSLYLDESCSKCRTSSQVVVGCMMDSMSLQLDWRIEKT